MSVWIQAAMQQNTIILTYDSLVETVKIECCIHTQRRPKPNYASVNFYREIANSGFAS